MENIPATSSRVGIDHINIVSYDDTLLDYSKESIAQGALDTVYGDSNKVATVYNRNNSLRIGDTIQFAGEEVEITCTLSQGLFGDDLIIICSQETFDRIMGNTKYGLIGIQLDSNATEETIAEIRSLGFLRGDGWGIVSSVLRKNRTGNTQISGNLLKVLRQSKDAYPYTTWIPSWELNLNNESPLRLMSQNASLIGIKALGESSELEKDGYLIVAVSESDLQSTYRSVAFDDSTAVLVDGNNQIISNVGEKLLGEQLKTGSDTQNIEYDLDIYNWKLCDMIPKQEYMKDAKDIRNFGVLICLAAILSTAFVSIVWSRKYTRPIELLMKNMHHVRYQEFEIDKPQKLGWEELDRLNEELYYTAQSIKDYIERLKLVEREKTKEELLALQYQMNPHFLLNSLNSIRWMAMMTNNKIVADTLVTLGKIITPMLRNPSLTWKIENEIEFLDNYVAMMQLRFGHDMEYSMNCSKEWYDLVFPRLILQPLIENCFVHGSSSEEIRTINVIIECNERIEVKVINSGVFFDEIQLKEIYMKMKTFSKASDHIGMANVYKRLNLLYGDQGSMRVESNRKLGFIVEVSFPKSTKM